MKEIPLTVYNDRPETFIDLNNGYWYYNYNITELEDSFIDEEGNEEKRYSALLLYFYGKPEYTNCVKLVIRKYISESEEFDLINSYNKSQLLDEDCQEYINYLNLLDEIKQNVKKDFGIYG